MFCCETYSLLSNIYYLKLFYFLIPIFLAILAGMASL